MHMGLGAALVAVKSSEWLVWSVLLGAATLGIVSEKTRFGAALSAPLSTMLTTLVLVNVGALPSASPVYTTINKKLVPLAVPLLLFNADLRRVVKDTGMLLWCFLAGAFATSVGTVLSFMVLPMRSLGTGLAGAAGGLTEGYKVACALCARHIGGAVNYVAVAETLEMAPEVVSAGIAADNVVVALYFALLFALAPSGEPPAGDGGAAKLSAADVSEPTGDVQVTLQSLSAALSLAALLVGAGQIATRSAFGAASSVSPLPVISVISVALATCFPKLGRSVSVAGAAAGTLCMQLFFAGTGAAGSLRVVAATGPVLLLYSFMQVGLHFVVLRALGRLLRLPIRELLLASNSNVGGPTTAAAMAQAKRWQRLVLPAMLSGILGYSCATLAALAVGRFFLIGLQ